MLALKFALMLAAALLLATAIAIPLANLWTRLRAQFRKSKDNPAETGTPEEEAEPIQWKTPVALALVACLPAVIATSIVVVPSGMGGVRISQIAGTLPGTLYPGVHFVTPLIQTVNTFDLRDHLFTAGLTDDPGPAGNPDQKQKSPLTVQSREGLSIALAVTVRYHLDPRRLDHVESQLPQPVDKEIVPPVVASAWRELTPSYTVQEIFSTKREEVRERAAATITRKLGADGIVVEEVMLRDIQLPAEYAKGLEGLLLKEQEDDQMGVATDIQQKQVKIAELQAEAEAVAKVKQSEGEAQSKVVEAKGEADAMQYTLPLKEKQIEQSKLEAEARKEATIQNAQADAEAKVIDSKAELERRNLFADAEANRIRLIATANAERMKSEASLLNQSPLLINKIVAERLSDKIQVMMVPSDGKFFFANDVFKSAVANPALKQQIEGADDAEAPKPDSHWVLHPRRPRRAECAQFRSPAATGTLRTSNATGRRIEVMVPKSKSTRLLALALAMFAAQAAHGASRWDKPATDLADRIAEILGPGQAQIAVTNRSTVPTAEVPLIRRLVEDELRARGVQPSGIESANQIRITLSETARQRLWVAEIVEGSQTRYAMVPFDREASPSQTHGSAMLLTQKALFSSPSPILAALETPSALVLLEPEAIVIEAGTAAGWQEAKRVSLSRRPFQSRDPRGLLLPSADGFTAYAPGAQCEGKFAAASDSPAGDWIAACHESDDPWPVIASNLGADPARLRAFSNPGRNFYTGVLAPGLSDSVPPFYSIAALPGPKLIIGGIDGKVQMLDGSTLKAVTGTRDWGSDFAAIRAGCGSGAQILATSSGEAQTDSLRAYELTGQEAVAASAPLELDGAVTALWTAPDGLSALAVIRKSPTEYEVARVSALCL